MEKNVTTLRRLVGILSVLLIIAIGLLINDRNTIKVLKAPSPENITAKRDIIREDCMQSDPDSVERCATDLEELSALLGQFSKHLHEGTTTPQQ